jgi:hypothetical protein
MDGWVANAAVAYQGKEEPAVTANAHTELSAQSLQRSVLPAVQEAARTHSAE